MDIKGVLAADVFAHLADGFQKGQPLDVADRAADLHDQHIGLGLPSSQDDPPLDLIGHMGDDLDRAAQENHPAAPG